MTTMKARVARSKLCRLINETASSHKETASSHKPIIILGKRSNAVLVSEDDWRAIQETVYLLSIPRMRQSIRKGLTTPIKQCAKQLSNAPSQ
jgi:PHD/YefM family antitoxin component YafN of YafNO toxin-antitoxin module